jgi:hypothetical protein
LFLILAAVLTGTNCREDRQSQKSTQEVNLGEPNRYVQQRGQDLSDIAKFITVSVHDSDKGQQAYETMSLDVRSLSIDDFIHVLKEAAPSLTDEELAHILGWHIAAWLKIDPNGTRAWLLTSKDDKIVNSTLACLVVNDPQMAFDTVDFVYRDSGKAQGQRTLLAEYLGGTNLDNALDLLRKYGDKRPETRGLIRDALGAYAYKMERGCGIDEFRSVIYRLSEEERSLAMHELIKLSHSVVINPSEPLADSMSRIDMKISDPFQRGIAISILNGLIVLGEDRNGRVENYVTNNLDGPGAPEVRASILEQIAIEQCRNIDPELAVKWMLSKERPASDTEVISKAIFSEWLKLDEREASAAIDKMSSGIAKDEAVLLLVTHLVEAGSKNEALPWVEQIQASEKRVKANDIIK